MKPSKTIAVAALATAFALGPSLAQDGDAADAAPTEAEIAAAEAAAAEAQAEAEALLTGPFAEVEGVWAETDELCGTAPWQIFGNEFSTGSIGAICSFDPLTLSASENRSATVTSFTAEATCLFGEDASDWNYAFMLSSSGQTLWVSASNALERTLLRCDPAGSDSAPFPGE